MNLACKLSVYSKMSREERTVVTIAEIIQELLIAHKEGRDVNLNKLKTQIASKYGLETSPRLVDIIASVPQESRKILYPKLKAKPIRTASGVSSWTTVASSLVTGLLHHLRMCTFFLADRCRCRHVQTSSLPSHQHDGEHLRLLSWRSWLGFWIFDPIIHRLWAYFNESYPCPLQPVSPD